MNPPSRFSTSVENASGTTQEMPWPPVFTWERPARSRSTPRASSFDYSTIIAVVLDYMSVACGVASGLLVYHLLGKVWVSDTPFKVLCVVTAVRTNVHSFWANSPFIQSQP